MRNQVTSIVEVFIFFLCKDLPSSSSLQQNTHQGAIRIMRTAPCSMMYELLPVVSIQDSILSPLYSVLWTNVVITTQHASSLSMAKSYAFQFVRSVEDQNQTVFSRAASTPPWCSSFSNGRTFLRRTSYLCCIIMRVSQCGPYCSLCEPPVGNTWKHLGS